MNYANDCTSSQFVAYDIALNTTRSPGAGGAPLKCPGRKLSAPAQRADQFKAQLSGLPPPAGPAAAGGPALMPALAPTMVPPAGGRRAAGGMSKCASNCYGRRYCLWQRAAAAAATGYAYAAQQWAATAATASAATSPSMCSASPRARGARPPADGPAAPAAAPSRRPSRRGRRPAVTGGVRRRRTPVGACRRGGGRGGLLRPDKHVHCAP